MLDRFFIRNDFIQNMFNSSVLLMSEYANVCKK